MEFSILFKCQAICWQKLAFSSLDSLTLITNINIEPTF